MNCHAAARLIMSVAKTSKKKKTRTENKKIK